MGASVVGAEGDDINLVRRAQEGYLEAFSELVRLHGPLAYRVALRMLGDHHDAEDVAQESLVSAWQPLPRFKAESSYPTWLYRIVTRRALNRITRAKPTGHADLLQQADDAGAEPARTVERNEHFDAVTQAITALPPAQRIVVVLCHLEGLSYADVARITNSTVPAVRSHLHRARRTLTVTLEEWR